jgi:hypothetical protein
MTDDLLHDLAEIMSPRELEEFTRKHVGQRIKRTSSAQRQARNAEIRMDWENGSDYVAIGEESHPALEQIRVGLWVSSGPALWMEIKPWPLNGI